MRAGLEIKISDPDLNQQIFSHINGSNCTINTNEVESRLHIRVYRGQILEIVLSKMQQLNKLLK